MKWIKEKGCGDEAQKRKKQTLLVKIFSLVASVTLISAALNATGSVVLWQTLLKSGMSEQEAYINAYADSMDDVFGSLSQLVIYLESNTDLQRIRNTDYKDQPDYLKNESNIFKTLSMFSLTSKHIGETFLLSTKDSMLYTSGGRVSSNVYFNNRFVGDHAEWDRILNDSYPRMIVKKLPFVLKEDGVRQVNSTIFAFKTIRGENGVLGMLGISIKDSFVKSLFADAEFAKDRLIYVCNEEEEVLACNTATDLSAIPLHQNGKAEEAMQSDSYYVQNKGLVSKRNSVQHGILYLIFTPSSVLTSRFDTVLIALNIASLILAAILIVCGYVSSRRLYRPFRTIVDTLREINEPKPLESADEIEYMREKVLDIVSVNYNLCSKVQDSSSLVLQTVLFKLLRGTATGDERIGEPASYGIVFPKGVYGVYVLKMELQTEVDEEFSSRYYAHFTNVIHSALEKWIIALVETGTDEYTVVFHCYDNEQELTQIINEIHKDLMKEIPQSNFTVGFGGYVVDIMYIKTCYAKAVKAIRNRRISNRNAVLFDDQNEGEPYFLPAYFEVELSAMLKENHFEDARKYLLELLDQNVKNDICFEEYLQMGYVLNGFLLRFMKHKLNAAYKNTIHMDLTTNTYGIERINEIILFNLSVLVAGTENPSAESVSAIEMVTDYVEKNYTQDINLSIVAVNLGYTPNYLSRLFKQNMGMNFTDYINRKRVEFAKMRICTTQNTIKQIAQEAGFNSTTLFIRTFERYEGLTPGEFRKLKQE